MKHATSLNQTTYKQINRVLMNWNPIGVEGPALEDEYTSFIPEIFSIGPNRKELATHLSKLVSTMGLEVDPENKSQQDEIEFIALELATAITGSVESQG